MLKKGSFMAVLAVLAVSLFFGLCKPAESLEVLTPEAGQILTAGSAVDISWEDTTIRVVTLTFSSDGGSTWSSIARDVEPSSYASSIFGGIYRYKWLVPDITSDHCFLTIAYSGTGESYKASIFVYKSAEFKIHQTPGIGTLPGFMFSYIAAPTNLEVESTGSDYVTLSWEDKSTNEDGFKVERKTGGQAYEEIASLPAGRETYDDDSAAPATEYSYRVKAFNSSTASAYSNEVSATTDAEAATTIPAEPGEPAGPDQPSATGSGAVEMKFYIGSTEYYVGGQLKTMDTAPLIFEGRTILPIRYVADALGAQVAWAAQERKVTINGSKTIELTIDNPVARVDGALTFIDSNNEKVTPVILPPGRTMLPLRFTAETLGCSVVWKADTQEITLRYPQN